MPLAALQHSIASVPVCHACALGAECRSVAAPARAYVRGLLRWDRTWAALGLAPLGRRDFAKVGKATPSAARRAVEAARKAGRIKHSPALLRFEYRIAKQRGSNSLVVVDVARHPDPRSSLETLVGPLIHFEAAAPPKSTRLSLSGGSAPRLPADPPRPAPATRLPFDAPLRIRVPHHEPTRSIPRIDFPPLVPRHRAPTPDPETPAGRIEHLAREVGRLSISRHDPEQFFVQRSEIAGQLRQLARQVA